MRHVTGISLAVLCGICLFAGQQSFADQITLVPLRGQLIAESGQSSSHRATISADGYSEDVQTMNSDSDQLTVKIADRHETGRTPAAKRSQDDDGATIKLIKLARRQ